MFLIEYITEIDMLRNLDLTSLRSFVAVADSGGVTRAAGLLNLTQSAVSMQLKRLEDALDVPLLDRSGRGVAVTAEGEQLLSYARRMLGLNDEAISRLTAQEYEGEITLGVPNDIVYPFIPLVLQRFNAMFPRMRVNLLSSYTRKLRELYARGACGIILTTEQECDADGETLTQRPLVWIGAPGGVAWRARPLRLAFGRHCIFRPNIVRQLDEQGVPWEMAVESDSDRTIEATVSADLAVTAIIEGAEPPLTERIIHNGTLPKLNTYKINLYVSDLASGPAETALADLVRDVYRNGGLSLSKGTNAPTPTLVPVARSI
ncbi:MAG: DNA-binding transcriptional LysR family regulator [Paracoccaceae bacterium]|jgi:DNA-binding transcriptional LysR family regulator